ncbi:MAG: hypothetical protein JW995_14490 [Melioribacteraceae bacterium]|nr:hypothetical protein [Melioribacteraceae bacterium]
MSYRAAVPTDEKIVLARITSLWALSESALGGILHAFKIPFTGLVLGSLAVIFLSILNSYTDDKKNLLKSTTIVILVKFIISPHSPFTAYFAVILQGTLAFVLYSFIRYDRIASYILAVSVLCLSAFQRLIIITILFGEEFWSAINLFIGKTIDLFTDYNSTDFNVSLLLITIYILVHFAAGIYAGFLSVGIKKHIQENHAELLFRNDTINEIQANGFKKRKRNWYNKKFNLIVITFFIAAFIYSFIFPEFADNLSGKIIYIIIRAITVLLIWFKIISPLIMKWFSNYLKKKKSAYGLEIDKVFMFLPKLRGIVVASWDVTSDQKYLRRINKFLILVIYNSMLISE